MAVRFRQRTRSLTVLSVLGVLSAAGGTLTAAGSSAAPGPDRTATHTASVTVAMTCPLAGPVPLTVRTTATLPASVKTGQTLSIDDFTTTFTLPHAVAQTLTTTGRLAGGLTFGLAIQRDDKKDTIPVPMTFAPTAVPPTGDVTLTATGQAPGLALDTPGAVTLNVTAPTLALSPAPAGTGTSSGPGPGPGSGPGTSAPGPAPGHQPGAPGTGTGTPGNGTPNPGTGSNPTGGGSGSGGSGGSSSGGSGSGSGSSTGSSTGGGGGDTASGSATDPSTPPSGEPPATGTTPPTGSSPTGTPPAKQVACTLAPDQPTELGTLVVLPGQGVAAGARAQVEDDEPLTIVTPLVLVRIVAKSTVRRLGANLTSSPTALLNGVWTIRLDPNTGIPIDSTVSGTTSFKPLQSTFLGFGFVPVTATVEFLPVDYLNARQIPINGTITTDANNASILTTHIDVMARLSNAKVNGQPLDVGPDCVTSQPVGLDVRGPYEPLGVGSIGTDPNSPDPKFRGFTLPPFRGCGATEPLSPLLTGMASGPGNQAHVETLNLAECTTPDHNQCPPDANSPGAQAAKSPR
ncbi:DUF6801 domain-containing protein [Amycolatopsis sp. PS_44_ISF1]|uniref:DUF6801 domain-containing protein n=1 Tax=Amycolatopsis sp. PS_44_ISF1 TaxID=2974917 RepID=UPI0028DED819|nr:DUF6801 domain-containing protein [Amycolatopsis sp. PS_44_ISF1]MDT8915613.1 hypothetical protein [Amycolatopsis sp. PS_44_ISF1]